MNRIALPAIVIALCGCAVERAAVAGDAQNQMVGLSKEQVLACMGAPASKTAEGATEVWGYGSGDGSTFSSSYASATGTATATRMGNMATANGTSNGFGFSHSSQRYCVVNIVMSGGKVYRVNYSGPTGGLITGGEQCAFAVRNCVH